MLCKKDGKAQQKIDIIFTEYSIFITKKIIVFQQMDPSSKMRRCETPVLGTR